MLQLAQEQAQSLEASSAAEERIQALEQRLAAHQQAITSEQGGAGEPPAMAAPGAKSCAIVSCCHTDNSSAGNESHV